MGVRSGLEIKLKSRKGKNLGTSYIPPGEKLGTEEKKGVRSGLGIKLRIRIDKISIFTAE